jgi:hypothetical protein
MKNAKAIISILIKHIGYWFLVAKNCKDFNQ